MKSMTSYAAAGLLDRSKHRDPDRGALAQSGHFITGGANAPNCMDIGSQVLCVGRGPGGVEGALPCRSLDLHPRPDVVDEGQTRA